MWRRPLSEAAVGITNVDHNVVAMDAAMLAQPLVKSLHPWSPRAFLGVVRDVRHVFQGTGLVLGVCAYDLH